MVEEHSQAARGGTGRLVAGLVALCGLGWLASSALVEAPEQEPTEEAQPAEPETPAAEAMKPPPPPVAAQPPVEAPDVLEEEPASEPVEKSKPLTEHQVTTRTAPAKRVRSLNTMAADSLVEAAETALETGDLDRAIKLSQQSQHSRKTPRALAIEVQAHCGKRDAARAQQVFARITGAYREVARGACEAEGITLE